MSTDKRILERLEEWQREKGSLPEALEFYRDLLRIQTEAAERVSPPQPALAKTEIAAGIRKGIPVLTWDALSTDWPAFGDLFQTVAAAIARHTEYQAESLKGFASDASSVREATQAWYEGSSLSPWASRQGIDEETLAAAIQCTFKPFLSARAQGLIGLVPQEQWRRGYCPICGGKPDFAFLDKERGARWLLCSRCDAEWLFQRLECPYCGCQDQDKLKYFGDEEGLYRLYVCQRCKSYLKAIDLRKTEAEILLPLERVLTLDMDRQGQEKGYRAGQAAASPNEDR